jgi:DNA polymerase-4
LDRRILHADFNSFYASVACFLDPALRPHPVAVAGNPEARHGIILAKNELAKRFGVKTGEAIWQAKQKCPLLVTVKPDFASYQKFSALGRAIYGEYSDQVEAFGLDENWIDVSACTETMEDAAPPCGRNSLPYSRRAGHHGFHRRCGQQGIRQARFGP